MKAGDKSIIGYVFYILFALSIIAIFANCGMLSLFFRNGGWGTKETMFLVAAAVHAVVICVSPFVNRVLGIVVLSLGWVLEILILPLAT